MSVGIRAKLVSWMVTDLEDSKTHTISRVWSGEYMDHGFTKSMSELDRYYTMLQELCSVIVGKALIHKNREGSKHEDFLKLPMKICPIEGYQVCRVPATIGKSYKVEVLCIMHDIDERHILLGRPWQCEVNGKYDAKRNLYLFSWEGRRIDMVSPKVTPQLPKPEVKVEENIVKAEVRIMLKISKISQKPDNIEHKIGSLQQKPDQRAFFSRNQALKPKKSKDSSSGSILSNCSKLNQEKRKSKV
nr:hypothetical protein [Tanacetum cinerariifolium]